MDNPVTRAGTHCSAAGITEPPSAPLDPLPYIYFSGGVYRFNPRPQYEQDESKYL